MCLLRAVCFWAIKIFNSIIYLLPSQLNVTHIVSIDGLLVSKSEFAGLRVQVHIKKTACSIRIVRPSLPPKGRGARSRNEGTHVLMGEETWARSPGPGVQGSPHRATPMSTAS